MTGVKELLMQWLCDKCFISCNVPGVSQKKSMGQQTDILRMVAHSDAIFLDMINTLYLVMCEVSPPFVKHNLSYDYEREMNDKSNGTWMIKWQI